MAIVFSKKLTEAIRQAVNIHAQELGDELDGVEEVVGDYLDGENYTEWSKLTEEHGFTKLTSFVKERFYENKERTCI